MAYKLVRRETGSYSFIQNHSPRGPAQLMPLPKAGDSVKISMLNGETIEGVVEWIDGNGAWVRSAQRSRWVPLEALQPPSASTGSAAKQESDSSTRQ